MNINFNNDIPIYLQIVDYLKVYIISGKLKSGDKIPSVRDLSSTLKVNPNTMQKSLTELENLKLIYTERTNGKYVTTDSKLISKYKKEYATNLTKKYLIGMQELGLTKKEIKNIMEENNGIIED